MGLRMSSMGLSLFSTTGYITRTPRYPRYSDHELTPFFAEIAKGYGYKQAAARCLYPHEWILNTLYSDDEVFTHVLDLSMVAGAQIRAGERTVPSRWDGLYDPDT